MKIIGMSFIRIAAMAATCLLAASQGFAAPITETFSFSLGGFVDGRSFNDPPSTAVTGIFTATFDPTISVAQGSPVDLENVSVPGVSLYYPYAAAYFGNLNLLVFGGLINNKVLGYGLGVYILLPALSAPILATCDNPFFGCVNLTGNPNYTASNYTAGAPAGSDFFASAAASNVTVTAQGTMPVPEPMSLGLLGVGLAGLGLIRRRMRAQRADASG